MDTMLAVYIGATVFGVGVTIADLVGAFSSIGEGGEGDADVDIDAGDADADADFDGDLDGDFEVDAGDGGDGGDGEVDVDGDEAGGDEDADESGGSVAGHDKRYRIPVGLRILSMARNLVYFALGFGPVGWFATTQYDANATTLAWSLPVGVAVMVTARGLRRLMRRDLTSSIDTSDLLMEPGKVTVSIMPQQMGKVRVLVSGVYTERFARGRDAAQAFPVGTAVRVVDADDTCVYVEKES
jgi:membrane protein implicated in regulation of membrane protease activity